MKLSFKKIVFELSLIMPMLYTLVYCFKASLANKLVILQLIFSYFLINSIYSKKRKSIKFFLLNFLLAIFLLYTYAIDSIGAIVHINFYSYVFMFIMFLISIDNETRNELFEYYNSKKKNIIFYFFIFLVIILYTCFFSNGIKWEFDSKLPILYGPFEITHILAYIFLTFYCMFAITDITSKSKFIWILKIICFAGIIFTAVRSAAIALAILMLQDFISIRSISKKMLIFLFGVLLLILLLTNTNILMNNPIVGKTIIASNTGTITNGREIFRNVALDYYVSNTNVFEKIFGIGINKLEEVIFENIGVKIHAHNDYVNLLVGYGIVGFFLMIYLQLILGKNIKNKISKILFHLFIFVLCFYNGLAMYIQFIASFPIVICFFDEKSRLILEFKNKERSIDKLLK